MRLTIGACGKLRVFHIERPSNPGYSFDGYKLTRRWEKDLPEDLDACRIEEKPLCEVCIKAVKENPAGN